MNFSIKLHYLCWFSFICIVTESVLIPDDDLKFLSHWSAITVNDLKKYESSTDSIVLLKNLTREAFNQSTVSWPLVLKLLRLRSPEGRLDQIEPSIKKDSDQLILAFTGSEMWIASNQTDVVTLSNLRNIESTHLTYGQARILVDSFLTTPSSSWSQVPDAFKFSMPSNLIGEETNLSTLQLMVKNDDKMYPAQRFAVSRSFSKTSPSELVIAATKNGVTESALEFLSPTQLKSNIADIRAGIMKLSEQQRSNVAYFPKPLVYAWQEVIMKTPQANVASFEVVSILSMSCSVLDKLNDEQVPQVISAYNDFVLKYHSERLKTMPLSLRDCFVEHMRKLLLTRMTPNSDPGTWLNALTVKDVQALGGVVLAGFNVTEVNLIADQSLKASVIRAIGKVPLPELMPVAGVNKLKELTQVYIDSLSTLSSADINTLGSLAFFIPLDKWSLVSAQSIQSFIETTLTAPHQKCVCLPSMNSHTIRNALIKAYGVPAIWKASTLATLNELLVVLDQRSVDDVKAEAWVSALPYLVSTKNFHDRHYDSFPGFVGHVSFSKACQAWLNNDEDAAASKLGEDRFVRVLLRASQLIADIAVRDATSFRRKRQVQRPSEVKDPLVAQLHAKAASILTQRYRANQLTPEQSSVVLDMVKKFENDTQKAVMEVLGLKEIPTNITAVVSTAISSGELNNTQITRLMQSATSAQKDYIINVVNLLNLTYKDFEIDEGTFCRFLGKSDCPSGLSSTTTPSSVTSVPTSSPTTTVKPVLIMRDDAFEFNGTAATFALKATDILPENITCRGLLTAGWAAQGLKASDLRQWNESEFLNCLEIIGKIEWSPEEAITVWSYFSHVNIDASSELTMFFGNLLPAVASQTPDKLVYNLTEVVDQLSGIGKTDLDIDLLKSIGGRLESTNKLSESISDTTAFNLVALRNLVCGLSVDVVNKMMQVSGVRPVLLRALGAMTACPNRPVLEVLAKHAAEESKVSTWLPSDVASYGIIVAGLSPEELSTLSDPGLAALTPSAVRSLTPDHLRRLSVDKLVTISPESLSVLRVDQVSRNATSPLSVEKLSALRLKMDSTSPVAREVVAMLKTSASASTSTSTSASSVSSHSSLSVIVLCFAYYFLF